MVYKVNPFCPYCGEEHIWVNIEITDEEQELVDAYYLEHRDKSTFELLLMPPPLYVPKTFRCPICDKQYGAKVAIRRDFVQPPKVQAMYKMAERAKQQSKENTITESIRKIMNNLGLTTEQAMTALEVPESDRPKYRELLQQQ